MGSSSNPLATLTEFDFSGPDFVVIRSFAQRIDNAGARPTANANPELRGIIDDLLGTIMSLALAIRYHARPRTRPIEFGPIKGYAKEMAAGVVSFHQSWLGGFYLNNAVYRSAAVYHRLLKIVAVSKRTTSRPMVPDLIPDAVARYPAWKNANLDFIHNETNTLKHTPKGLHDGRTVEMHHISGAIGETLDLLEAYLAARLP